MMEPWLEFAELVLNLHAEEVDHDLDYAEPNEDMSWNSRDLEAEDVAQALNEQISFWGRLAMIKGREQPCRSTIRCSATRSNIRNLPSDWKRLHKHLLGNRHIFVLFCARSGYPDALQYEGREEESVSGRLTRLYLWKVVADQRLHDAITAQIRHMFLPKFPRYIERKLTYRWFRGDGPGSISANPSASTISIGEYGGFYIYSN